MLRSVLLVLLLSYIAVAALAFLFADRLLFLPPASSYLPNRLPVVQVSTDDGARIAVLHLPNPSASLTLLYSHGNAEDLGHLVDLLEAIRDSAGVSVLAYDYRGYGLSTGGAPTAAATKRDIDAVFRHATREIGVPSTRLILHGRSVGTGPTLELAVRERVAGVIVESGFVSAFRVMTHVPLLPFDRFPNLRHMHDVRVPVLVIHGTADEVIPFSHGQRLFRAAPGPKWRLWVEGAGHNDLVDEAGSDYWRALRDFVRAVETGSGTA
jgi:fermentation-respiration switch protein FrsA (DUF1100 family)